MATWEALGWSVGGAQMQRGSNPIRWQPVAAAESLLGVSGRQRTEVGDDGLRVRMAHVIDVHGLANGLAIRSDAAFHDILALLVAIFAEARQRRRVIGTVRIRVHGNDPDLRALQPAGLVEISGRIAGGVALLAH